MKLRLRSRVVRLMRAGYSRLVTAVLWKIGQSKNELGTLVYDIGFHLGQDTAFYLKKGFRVIAVEADPELAKAGARRFSKEIASSQLILLNLGIVNDADVGTLTFYVNTEISEWSSFNRDLASRAGNRVKEVQVEGSTLGEIMRRHGEPFFIKIDIEGHDRIALASILESGFRPGYVSVENGAQGMLRMLEDAGYNRFKYVQQNSVHSQEPPFPSRHGNYVKQYFVPGSSGLFGEEAPGDWADALAIKQKIAAVWDPDGVAKNPNHDDIKDGWFDLHARHANLAVKS